MFYIYILFPKYFLYEYQLNLWYGISQIRYKTTEQNQILRKSQVK